MLESNTAVIRPALIDCFPHPAANGAGSSSVDLLAPSPQLILNEWRRLYSLIALCCAADQTHLMVAADAPSQLTLDHFVPMLPRGPKYFELRLLPEMSRGDVCEFMARAEMANVTSSNRSSGGGAAKKSYASQVAGGGATASAARATASPWHHRPLSTGGSSSDDEEECNISRAAMSAAMAAGGPPHPPPSHQRRVVVFLHRLEMASADVQSAIMDIVANGVTRTAMGARRVPSIRIVACCVGKVYTAIPPYLRAAFALSTSLCAAACQRSVDLQDHSADRSAVLNHAVLQELLVVSGDAGAEGTAAAALLDAVHLSPVTERYLFDVVVCLRSSLVPHSSTALSLVARIPQLLLLLRLAALLFSASDDRLEDTLDGVGRVVVTPTDVACLMPHFVVHTLQISKREALEYLGAGGSGSGIAGNGGISGPRNAATGSGGNAFRLLNGSGSIGSGAWSSWDACVVHQPRAPSLHHPADAMAASLLPMGDKRRSVISHGLMAPFVAHPGVQHAGADDLVGSLGREGAWPFVAFAEAAGIVIKRLRTSCFPPG